MDDVLSIVIPCYNQAHFLGEAIASALAQDYSPVEIVVVDDGSTDDTAAVAARHPSVRCLRQPNRGLPAARNAGWQASMGRYVIFLDADDRLLPNAASVGVAALAARPDAGVAVGLARRIGADGSPLPTPRRPRVDSEHYASLVRRCWMVVATEVYRRDALVAVGGFDERLRFAEDYDLYLRPAQRFPIVDHYTEVSEYRQHPGTRSRNVESMLAHTLWVLGRHRPGRGSSSMHRAAYRERDNVVWYFDRLLDAIRADLYERHWRDALRRALVFARYLPQHRRYAVRRLRRPIRAVARLTLTRKFYTAR
jgi:glycosyltransferase involved in cell wall biosynthesis